MAVESCMPHSIVHTGIELHTRKVIITYLQLGSFGIGSKLGVRREEVEAHSLGREIARQRTQTATRKEVGEWKTIHCYRCIV